MGEKFEIYFMLSSNMQPAEEADIAKLVGHMEETLIWVDLGQVNKLDIRYITSISPLLMKALESKDALTVRTLGRTAVVLLYLVSISNFSSQISSISNGILLNRYSKLMKLLSLGFEAVRGVP
jgi:hypothetical protein